MLLLTKDLRNSENQAALCFVSISITSLSRRRIGLGTSFHLDVRTMRGSFLLLFALDPYLCMYSYILKALGVTDKRKHFFLFHSFV